MMINRPLVSRSSLLYRGVSSLAVLVGIACSADHIVSIGTGVDTHRVTTGDGPPNPGGPTQQFRFRAVTRGAAIVTFTPLNTAPVVVDTIDVQ